MPVTGRSGFHFEAPEQVKLQHGRQAGAIFRGGRTPSPQGLLAGLAARFVVRRVADEIGAIFLRSGQDFDLDGIGQFLGELVRGPCGGDHDFALAQESALIDLELGV